MNRPYRVSYRLFWNTTLKEAPFGKVTSPPLYFQIVYQRKKTTIKSTYFDAISRMSLGLTKEALLESYLDQLVKWESRLVDGTISELGDDFTLERFRDLYGYYGLDLIEQLEEGFKAYMLVYFVEHGFPNFGKALVNGCKPGRLYDVLGDLARIDHALYNDMILKAGQSKQPFVVVYEYFQSLPAQPYPLLNIYEWQATASKDFEKYLQRRVHSAPEVTETLDAVESWLHTLKPTNMRQ